jgi:hypothetical protein
MSKARPTPNYHSSALKVSDGKLQDEVQIFNKRQYERVFVHEDVTPDEFNQRTVSEV